MKALMLLLVTCSVAVAGESIKFDLPHGLTVTDDLVTEWIRLIEGRAAVENISGTQYWSSLSASQQAVVYTVTGVLWCSAVKSEGLQSRAINEVMEIVAVLGSNGKRNGNRRYSRLLIRVSPGLRELILNPDKRLPDWRRSGDRKGPHAPFNVSIETFRSRPRGQMHLFERDEDAVNLEGLAARFKVPIDRLSDHSELLVEMDLDYDFLHGSSPYGNYSNPIFEFLSRLGLPKFKSEPGISRYIRVWAAQ